MSGTEPPALDLTAQAVARSAVRLAVLRSPEPARAAGAVPLPTAPPLPPLLGISPVDSVPEAVWEDAQRQQAGVLEGLETLQRAVPALGQPAGAASSMSPVAAAGGGGSAAEQEKGKGHGHAEQAAPQQKARQQDEGGRP